MSDTPDTLGEDSSGRQMFRALAKQIVVSKAEELGALACKIGGSGLAITMMARGGRQPGTPTDSGPASVVLVMGGKIPDDLIDGLANYVKAMAQDVASQPGMSHHHVEDDLPTDKTE